ncbi:hypothetical protein ACNI3K_06750 [Demequina sp. SO4-13]|uniref:AMIN-like domain-containing (lipo)protein n=1 Tax=Demequina sp. SO4-13 TaxID=3401027 RepID=UPI003AF78050
MRHEHLTRTIALTAAGGLLIAGCGSEDPEVDITTTSPTTATPTDIATTITAPTPSPSDEPVSTPTETVTTQPDPAEDDEPPEEEAPFPADRATDTADASGDAQLSPVDMRFGVHEGYDRIVLDLEGPGQPGWSSSYVDEPTMAGSGRTVDLAGEASLVTHVDGVVYPTEEDAAEYEGPERFQPEAAGVIEEVVYGSVYEGQVDIYVGLSSEEPFRVFSLEDPTRVVIDVQHP